MNAAYPNRSHFSNVLRQQLPIALLQVAAAATLWVSAIWARGLADVGSRTLAAPLTISALLLSIAAAAKFAHLAN